MVFRLLGKLFWGTTKLTVKHIVIPIAITAATAVILDELTKKVREEPSRNGRNGRVDVIRPGP